MHNLRRTRIIGYVTLCQQLATQTKSQLAFLQPIQERLDGISDGLAHLRRLPGRVRAPRRATFGALDFLVTAQTGEPHVAEPPNNLRDVGHQAGLLLEW